MERLHINIIILPICKLMVFRKLNMDKAVSLHVFGTKPNHVLIDPCTIFTTRTGSSDTMCKSICHYITLEVKSALKEGLNLTHWANSSQEGQCYCLCQSPGFLWSILSISREKRDHKDHRRWEEAHITSIVWKYWHRNMSWLVIKSFGIGGSYMTPM